MDDGSKWAGADVTSAGPLLGPQVVETLATGPVNSAVPQHVELELPREHPPWRHLIRPSPDVPWDGVHRTQDSSVSRRNSYEFFKGIDRCLQ